MQSTQRGATRRIHTLESCPFGSGLRKFALDPVVVIFSAYRISANSFRGNYSFLEVEVRQLFKGGNYSREETIKNRGF